MCDPFPLFEGFVYGSALGEHYGDQTVHAASMGQSKSEGEIDRSGSLSESVARRAILRLQVLLHRGCVPPSRIRKNEPRNSAGLIHMLDATNASGR